MNPIELAKMCHTDKESVTIIIKELVNRIVNIVYIVD